MGTKITKSNVRSAIRDDKAHMDYLKRDVRDDQRAGGRYKDINQTADEKHISKLAGDIKADGHFLSKHWNHSSPLNNIDMVGSAGSFDSGMHEPVQHEEFDAEGFDADRRERQAQIAQDMEDLNKASEVQPGDGDPPTKFVDVVSGEVDGVAYGAADVDGHIAVDTATVGYDDTMNLP